MGKKIYDSFSEDEIDTLQNLIDKNFKLYPKLKSSILKYISEIDEDKQNTFLNISTEIKEKFENDGNQIFFELFLKNANVIDSDNLKILLDMKAETMAIFGTMGSYFNKIFTNPKWDQNTLKLYISDIEKHHNKKTNEDKDPKKSNLNNVQYSTEFGKLKID